MSFGVREVRSVLDAFEKSSWNSIYLRSDGCELRVTRGDVDSSSPPRDDDADLDLSDNLPTVERGVTAENDSDETVDTSVGTRPSAAERERAPAVETDASLSSVTAPTTGIFWRAPQPGAPPFVDTGAVVEPDTTICIVEVMKLMNHIKAGVEGEVIEVLAANGEHVELGQALFTIARKSSE